MKDGKQQPKKNNDYIVTPSLKEVKPGYFGVVENALTGQFDSATKNVREQMEDNRHTGVFNASKGRLQITSSGSFKKTESGALERTETGRQVLEGLTATVSRVLLAMREQLYKDEQKEGLLDVKNYAKKCSLNYKVAKVQVRDTLKYLYHTDIYDPETGLHCRVIQEYGEKISKGHFPYVYSDAFYNYLINERKFVNEISEEVWGIDLQKHPNSLFIYLKFCDRRRQNSTIVSIKTLLTVCSYPKYEDIKDSGAIERDIIAQLEGDLDHLANLFMWVYCHENGEPLSIEETIQEARQGYNYSEWIKRNIRIQWHDETNYDIGKIRERYKVKQELREQRAYKRRMKKADEKEAELEKREKELQEREQALNTHSQREENES